MNFPAYPEYASSEIWWAQYLPSHWNECRIRQLSPVLRGASPRPIDDPKYFDEEGQFGWVRISDVTASNGILERTTQRLSELGSSKTVKIGPGSLFLSIAGSVGKPCITNIHCCIHDGFVYFPRVGRSSKFLYYIFEGGQSYEGLGKFGTQLNLNTDTIGNIKVPLPPLPEQRTIADFLDHETAKIDALIGEQRRLIELLQEKRQAVISHAVTKGLNPDAPMKDSGVEWLGEVPQHWEVSKLKHVAETIPSNVDKHSKEEEKNVRLCNYTDVYYNDSIAQSNGLMKATATEDEIRRFRVYKGDVLITKDSETADDIGIPTYIEKDLEGVLCGYHLTIIRSGSRSNGKFLQYLFQSDQVKAYFEVSAKGLTRVGISQGAVGATPIAVPPLEEQEMLIQFLHKQNQIFERLISDSHTTIALLQERRSALISAAVTGKIDIRGWQPDTFENFADRRKVAETQTHYG